MKPDRDLSLDLTVKEAELLISASPDIISLAESGNLKALLEKCRQLADTVETDFLKMRDSLQRII